MSISERDFWTIVHGMGLGTIFLLAFAGGIVELLDLRRDYETPLGVERSVRRLMRGTVVLALALWLTVITGTYIVYPWYRAKPPTAAADLTDYPRSALLANPQTAAWHTFGMEWKEHVAWIGPMLATAVAYVAIRYRGQLAQNPSLRRALIVLFSIAFLTAAVSGALGALINKVAPTR